MDKKAKKESNDLREKLRLREQVEEQIQITRFAFVDGDQDAISRSIEVLRIMLWPWIHKTQRDEYDKIEYKQKTSSDFYTEIDKRQVKHFGELIASRQREITAIADNMNKEEFLTVAGKKFALLMEITKLLGIGFEISDSLVIGKKKDAQSGKS